MSSYTKPKDPVGRTMYRFIHYTRWDDINVAAFRRKRKQTDEDSTSTEMESMNILRRPFVYSWWAYEES